MEPQSVLFYFVDSPSLRWMCARPNLLVTAGIVKWPPHRCDEHVVSVEIHSAVGEVVPDLDALIAEQIQPSNDLDTQYGVSSLSGLLQFTKLLLDRYPVGEHIERLKIVDAQQVSDVALDLLLDVCKGLEIETDDLK